MQILSYRDIEVFADRILTDFSKPPVNTLKKTDIRDLAESYMGLSIERAVLSNNGSVLGLTSFADTVCEIWVDGENRFCSIPKNTILIDESLYEQHINGCIAFTIAHECAHHLLHREDFERNISKKVTFERSDSFIAKRRLFTANDWIEWQANALAAALLMPYEQMVLAVRESTGKSMIDGQRGYITYSERVAISRIAEFFGVSSTAMIIRLKKLNLITNWSNNFVLGPLEILCDEEDTTA